MSDQPDTLAVPEKVALAFESPAEVVALYDDEIRTGVASLHPWQLERLEKFGSVKPTAKNPYRLYLVAANSSGKDKYIISPFCIWFILSKIDAEVIVTSSSAQQLDNQTEKYMRFLASRVNLKHGSEILRVIKRRIECTLTGSTIRLFATDEPGKAEGYHPLTTTSEMAIVTNETKSIPDEIMEALMRCSGYNYWIEVSSPGHPGGHFYRSMTLGSGDSVRITSYDCPHISKDEIEFDRRRLGETSALFRSKHLALFTTVEQSVVLRREIIDKYIITPPQEFKTGILRAGLDLAAGGDETVLSVWDGNVQIGLEVIVCEDTERTVSWLADMFSKYNLSAERVWADDGGIGRNYYFSLLSRGFNVNRVLFNSAANNKREYINLGAEIWWRFARHFELGALKIINDSKLIDQLASRQYAQVQGGRFRLVKKSELRSQGYPSPDRADATVLANIPVTLEMAESWAAGSAFVSMASKPRSELTLKKAIEQGARNKLKPEPWEIIDDRERYAKSLTDKPKSFIGRNPANLLRFLYE